MKFLLAALSTLLALSVLAQTPDLLQRAAARLQEGRLDDAIADYRAYLRATPDDAEARSDLGAALARTGRFDDAIAEYNLALRLAPDNPAILLNLALANFKSGRYPAAIPLFERVAPLAPQFQFQASLLLATAHLRLDHFSQAVSVLAPFESAAAAEPAFQYLYGSALAGAGQLDRGAAILDRILRHGDSAEARLLQATLELQRHDQEAALENLLRAAKLNPGLPGVQVRLGELYFGRGEAALARQAFLRELELDPTCFAAYLHLGVLARQEQDYQEARRHLSLAARLRPADPALAFQIANLDLASGQLDAARQSLEALLAANPNFAEAHSVLATVFYRLNRPQDAQRQRDLAIRLLGEQESAARSRQGAPRR